ncbi:MAG TPA: efflux RND transporter periplasmic adaptor subunit [Tepidisphaeraceae bacterium]
MSQLRNIGILRSLGILLLFVVSLSIQGCTKPEASAQSSGSSAPAPVMVGQVAQRDVPVQIRAIASVEAFSTVTVKSRVAGQLLRVHVAPGQEVKKDDLLFEIDSRPFEIALHEAEARLERDTALANNAQVDAQRMDSLLKDTAATHEEADKARYAFQAAQATVRADQAMIDNAKLQIEFSKIHSPIDGRAGTLMADQGNVVKADETELLTINQFKPIWVTFNIPEVDLEQVRRHYQSGEVPQVRVTIPPETEPSETGKLSFIDNKVDRDTGTIRLKGTFENEDRRLWPGQFVQVTLDLTVEKDAVLIPSRAIATGQQGLYVFVVKDDLSVEMRPVKVRRTVGEESVIEPGTLAVGQRVVTDGQLRLVPGSKVEIKAAATTQQAASATPSPSRLGEGRGEGSSAPADRLGFREQPPPLPSPGVPGEGVRGIGGRG